MDVSSDISALSFTDLDLDPLELGGWITWTAPGILGGKRLDIKNQKREVYSLLLLILINYYYLVFLRQSFHESAPSRGNVIKKRLKCVRSLSSDLSGILPG